MTRSPKRRGVVVGFPYYGRYLSDLINERSSTWRLRYYGESYTARISSIIALRKCDVLISFGGPAPDAALTDAARRHNVPVIVIWAGTDVQSAASDPGGLEVIKQENHFNVSDGAWLVDELRELGISADYVPVTAIEPPSAPKPLPAKFRVISYLPEPRRVFYGEKLVYAVARAFPDIPFDVVGQGRPNPAAPPNVRFAGYVHNMPELLDRSTVLLRLPEHDGKSMLVLETLARGRHVVWTYTLPSVHQVNNVTEAIDAIGRLYERHKRGELDVNFEGFNYVRERFSRATIAAHFEEVLDRAYAAGSPRAKRTNTVAISGYPLFAAQVARSVQTSSLDWEPRILRGGSRLARLFSGMQLLRANVWYSIGSPIPDRWLHLLAAITRKPRVIHWVGSDVEILKTQSSVRRFCQAPQVRHLAEVDWMIDELAACGVGAALAPLPPHVRVPKAIPPLPERFTVLMYVPGARGDFYGRREYERLFRAFIGKPVRFIIVGGASVFVPPGADVEVLGWKTDLASVYERSSLLMRFTRHDGLALMALEALSYGRHLIWSQTFPFGTCARTYADCERSLNDLLERHMRGELEPQYDAARYISETYDEERCVGRIAEHWKQTSTDMIRPLAPLEANQ